MAASAPATLELLELARDFAAVNGLTVVETPSSALLKTLAEGSVANIYLAPWDTIDIPLQPLRDRGWDHAAEQAQVALQAITSKKLTGKNPIIPTVDAVVGWRDLRAVLERIFGPYSSAG